MPREATCRICGQRFSYGDRSAVAPRACGQHVEDWRRRVLELVDGCRPWQDLEATTNAMLDVMPDGTPDGFATMVAAEMRRLHPDTPAPVAVAMIGEYGRQVRDEPSPVAGMLRRLGVPERTAYALANHPTRPMRPSEALGYAVRRISRELETTRRLQGISAAPGSAEYRRARVAARRAAARRYP